MCMIWLQHVVVLPNIVLLFLMPNVMLPCVHTKLRLPNLQSHIPHIIIHTHLLLLRLLPTLRLWSSAYNHKNTLVDITSPD